MINEDFLTVLDNEGKLLYILKVMGPLRFEEIVSILNPYEKFQKKIPPKMEKKQKNSNLAGNVLSSNKNNLENSTLSSRRKHFMSRGTISKHLKKLKGPNVNYITQTAEIDPHSMRSILKYRLTSRGRGFINQLIKEESAGVSPDLFGMIYYRITDFFRSRGMESQLHLPRIISMIARINEAEFFKLPQNNDFYYTLLYIYQNSLEFSIGRKNLYYMELKNFSETYGVSQIQILAHLEKILQAELGYYSIKWKEDLLFFQKDDLFGAMFFNLLQDAIESEIIKKTLEIGNKLSFPEIAHQLADRAVELNFIRPQINIYLQKFFLCMLVITAQNRKLSRIDIIEYWPDLNNLLLSNEGVDLSKIIFGTTTEFEKIQAIEKAITLIG